MNKFTKEKLEFHLKLANKIKHIAVEDYKRGLLQTAVSFDLITDREWIQYLKKHCPNFAQ